VRSPREASASKLCPIHAKLFSFIEFSCVFRKREKRGGTDLRRTRAGHVCLMKSSECFRSVVFKDHEIRARKTSKLCPTRKLHFQIVPSLRETGTFLACRAREKPALLNCAQPAQHFQIMPNPRAALPNCAEPTQHFQIVPSLREAGASKSCPARDKRAVPNYA